MTRRGPFDPAVATRISKVIRKELLASAARVKGERVVVSLSGGVDSCAVLAALLETGVVPKLVSYTPDTHESTDFLFAQQTAENLGLHFTPVEVPMDADALDEAARFIMALGYTSKIQVESMTPFYFISQVAADQRGTMFMTGDQSDGYFTLSRWATYNYDRKQGVPHEEAGIPHVRYDEDTVRIDGIRKMYYANDSSCSEGIREVLAQRGLQCEFPFRSPAILKAFLGSKWYDINKPRIKEPIKQAFGEHFAFFSDFVPDNPPKKIMVRKKQVNLHKGDSEFGNTLADLLMTKYPGFASPRGLYSAMAKGEV